MNPPSLDLQQFLEAPGTLVDVRSPGEYSQGHIPGAVSLPLFSDKERMLVGTLYKQKSKEVAIFEGLKIVGPKLAHFVEEAKKLTTGQVKLYCFRGGMRSSSFGWLLQTAGISTLTLKGGYKSFRKMACLTLLKPFRFMVLGGLTGSGKTALLEKLSTEGYQVLNLEALASHRGSSYGGSQANPQPTNEHFENSIAEKLAGMDPHSPIWVEDESRMVGRCKIPDPLFTLLNNAPLIVIQRPLEERLSLLLEEYGIVEKDQLIACTERIRKKLGGARTAQAIAYIQEGRLKEAMQEVLAYYDKSYLAGLADRKQHVQTIEAKGLSDDEWLEHLKKQVLK